MKRSVCIKRARHYGGAKGREGAPGPPPKPSIMVSAPAGRDLSASHDPRLVTDVEKLKQDLVLSFCDPLTEGAGQNEFNMDLNLVALESRNADTD